jgi:hypothetical protein
MKIFFVFFLLSSALYAQTSSAYLVPRQIFVGDPATLVVQLPASSQHDNIILTALDTNVFPQDPNIDFHRIILEKRTTGSRLMIEFTAFSPGILELPVIEIGGDYFSGLTVTVNTLLDGRSAPTLSGAATVLAMPGTALMLYGSMAVILLLITFIIWFFLKGRRLLHELRKKWKRRRLFASMRKKENRLYKLISKGIDKRIILDELSKEFREFLSVLTGKNCHSMTSGEFRSETNNEDINENMQIENRIFLANYFCRCDELRFSGAGIEKKDIIQLLDDLKKYIDVLENINNNRNMEEKDR